MAVSNWLGKWKEQESLKELAQKMRGLGPAAFVLAATLGFLSWLFIAKIYENTLIQNMVQAPVILGGFLVSGFLGFWALTMQKTKFSTMHQRPVFRMVMTGMTIACVGSMTLLFIVFEVALMNPAYAEKIGQEGLAASLMLPTIWPRFFHILSASLAATGILITVYGTFRVSQPEEGEHTVQAFTNSYDTHLTRYGVGWTLAGTLPQILFGPWLFLALPPEVREQLLAGDTQSSVVFFVSLTAALLALVLLNASLMVPHVRGLVWGGIASLVLTIVLMVVIRVEVRNAWMRSHLAELTWPELSGWAVVSVMIIGLAGLLAFGRHVKLLNDPHSTHQTE